MLLIIGEKINGTLKSVAQAIANRNELVIEQLAQSQAQAGADFLDINAGTPPEREIDDLAWLIGVVQNTVETPICIDSTHPETLRSVLPLLKRPGIINSVNGDSASISSVLPLAKTFGCRVVALLMDDRGISSSAPDRMAIAERIMQSAREVGIADEDIYFDPLVAPVATTPDAGRVFLEVLRQLKQQYPKAKTVSGLSNISFGLPDRWTINRAFLAVAVASGMDAAIVDPLNHELLSEAKAARLVAGLDPYAREYLRFYRQKR